MLAASLFLVIGGFAVGRGSARAVSVCAVGNAKSEHRNLARTVYLSKHRVARASRPYLMKQKRRAGRPSHSPHLSLLTSLLSSLTPPPSLQLPFGPLDIFVSCSPPLVFAK
jgi:hypothetical protein